MNLTLAQPAISKENVLLIEGMYDLIGWGAPIELWQSWGQPDIWRLPHGHASTALTLLMPGLPGRLLRWLTLRLDSSTSQQHQMTPPNPAVQRTGGSRFAQR